MYQSLKRIWSRLNARRGTRALWSLIPLGIIGAICLLAFLRSGDACLSEELATIPNLDNVRFEVIYTNCDTLAKDEAIRVYMSPAVVAGNWFANWEKQRELVFQYDPGGNLKPPAILASSNNSILISVYDISSISVQRRTWRNISMSYKIGHIAYP